MSHRRDAMDVQAAAPDLELLGDGKLKQETRGVGAFQAVSVGSGMSAKASLGEKPSVGAEADENLLPLIRVVVKNDQLAIDAGTDEPLPPEALHDIPKLPFLPAYNRG